MRIKNNHMNVLLKQIIVTIIVIFIIIITFHNNHYHIYLNKAYARTFLTICIGNMVQTAQVKAKSKPF
jgi:hypothetical protein